MLVSSNLIYNKKRTCNMIIGVVASVFLLFLISLIFSSMHSYMVKSVKTHNPYHVSFKAGNFNKLNFISKKEYKNGTIYIKYKNIYDVYKNTDLICEKIKCQDIFYNDKLLSLYGISKKENVMTSFKTILIVLLIIVGIGVFIFLSNIFRISMFERKKQIGVLKSVGMDKFLIIKNLLLENTIVLIIGLIIGIVLSLWFTSIFLMILNFLLKDILEFKLKLSIYPLFVLISFVFIILIFYLASFLPIVKVSRLSIIEAIRGNDNFSKKKIPWYILKLKPLSKIIMFNYFRNKKNYKAIKFCVFISVMLYISFRLYLSYGVLLLDKYVKLPKYDFEIVSKYDKRTFFKLKKIGTKYSKYKIYKTCMIKDENVMVISYKKEGLLNAEKISINDKVITKKIKKIPFGLDSLDDKNIVFLTNDFDNYCNNYSLLMFVKGDSKKILKDLNSYKLEVNYVDVSKASLLVNNLILTIKISLYSILIIICLISIFLIGSTVSFSIKLREKQFGIFRSIGFTNLKLKKIVIKEMLIILVKPFVYIIIFSFLLDYILYENITKLMSVNMILPIFDILLSFLVAFVVIYLVVLFNFFKIKKKSIVGMLFK